MPEFEDYYGPCGCGTDVAIYPVLIPREWIQKRPEFVSGEDYRRLTGFSCNRIFEVEYEGGEYWANFSCCKDCAARAVEQGEAKYGRRRETGTGIV